MFKHIGYGPQHIPNLIVMIVMAPSVMYGLFPQNWHHCSLNLAKIHLSIPEADACAGHSGSDETVGYYS